MEYGECNKELEHKEHEPSGDIRNMELQEKSESVKNKECGTQRTGNITEHKEHGTPETSENKRRGTNNKNRGT